MTAATLSAVVTKAQYTFYRLKRIRDVAHNLVSAYWATTESERQMYVRNSLLCSELPILVPSILTLVVQAESEDVLAGTKSDEDSICTSSSVDSDHEYLSANTSEDESESTSSEYSYVASSTFD